MNGKHRRADPGPDALTLGELMALPAVTDLPTAARALGIGRTKAYELARRDQFACRVLRIGNSYRVPATELLRCLGIDLPQAAQTDL